MWIQFSAPGIDFHKKRTNKHSEWRQTNGNLRSHQGCANPRSLNPTPAVCFLSLSSRKGPWLQLIFGANKLFAQKLEQTFYCIFWYIVIFLCLVHFPHIWPTFMLLFCIWNGIAHKCVYVYLCLLISLFINAIYFLFINATAKERLAKSLYQNNNNNNLIIIPNLFILIRFSWFLTGTWCFSVNEYWNIKGTMQWNKEVLNVISR